MKVTVYCSSILVISTKFNFLNFLFFCAGLNDQTYSFCKRRSIELVYFLLTAQANLHNVQLQDCHIIGMADMNIPKTKSKENVQSICRCLAFLNDLNVKMNISLLEMPDVARHSCKRGLADEEAAVQQCLWALQQHCDDRFIVNFDVPAAQDSRCSFRTIWISKICVFLMFVK